MTVKEIVVEYLEKNGFDGLFDSGECACLKEELFLCNEGWLQNCEPGYKGPCPPDCGEHDWHVGPEKDGGD